MVEQTAKPKHLPLTHFTTFSSLLCFGCGHREILVTSTELHVIFLLLNLWEKLVGLCLLLFLLLQLDTEDETWDDDTAVWRHLHHAQLGSTTLPSIGPPTVDCHRNRCLFYYDWVISSCWEVWMFFKLCIFIKS